LKDLFTPEFLASLCHDLRGPAGALGTWVHVLGSGKASPETQARAITAMATDVRVMGGFIEQLSLLGQVAARTDANLVTLDLVPLLRSAQSAAAGDTDLRLRTEALEPVLEVRGEAETMQQIFALLGARALTAAGGERVVTLRRTGDSAEVSLESELKIRSLGAALLERLTRVQQGDFERSLVASRDVVRLRFPLAS